MARGQRKTIEEKITDKEALIGSLQTRIESEEKELEELYKEKREKELESISSLLEEHNISIDDAKAILEEHISKQ